MKKILLISFCTLAILRANGQTPTTPANPNTPAPATQTPPTPAPATPPPAPAAATTPPPAPAAPATQSDSKWSFGLNIAPSIKWLSTNTEGVKSNGTKVGFSYGFIANYRISSTSSFITGVDFSYRGGSIKSKDSSSLSYTADLQYFEIPVIIKMHTADIKNKSYYAKFGLAPGWYIGHKGDNLEGGINNFYTAMKIGGGVDFVLSGSTRLFAGIIWNNGFIDAAKSDDLEMKNQCVALEIGVTF